MDALFSGRGAIVGLFETKEMAESHIMSLSSKTEEHVIRRIVWGERVRSL